MGDFERTVREFKRTLIGGRQKTSPLDIMGKVTRVEDGVAWVRFAGSEVGDTPVRMNMDCKEGDDVQVRSSGGKAWIVGNQSAPPTDDSKAEEVEKKTTEIVTRVEKAEKVAGSAADIANAVNQKVWSDEAGLHIADGKKDAAAERNSIWNSLGMLFREGLNPILGILTGDNPRVAIYDGQGSGEEHEVANFGESARMGKKESSHVSVESNRIVAEDGVDDGMYGVKYFDVGLTESASVMYMTQNWTVSEQVTGRIFELSYYPVNLNSIKVNGSTAPFEQSVDNPKQIYIPSTLGIGDEVEISYTTYGANSYFTFGQRLPGAKVGDTSFASGNNVVASGRAAHAEGIQTVASAPASHAEGYKSAASYSYAHAEGANTTAKDYATHAEGQNTTASGYGAHSEGQNTTADFESAHAEGKGTYAGYGSGAHAEGVGTIAKGIASHAEGKGTIAREGSHVEGSYNIEDTSDDYAHIIGNGSSDNDRSNALTVDWDGTIRTHKNSMKTLLTTASYMNASQDLTFSEPVSEQLTGIVLVWSFWSTKAEDYGWRTFFVPKAMVQLHNGVGYDCPLSRPKSSYFGSKYVYIYDTHIKGHADNVATGTANNVPYANNKWVLRYVFGC